MLWISIKTSCVVHYPLDSLVFYLKLSLKLEPTMTFVTLRCAKLIGFRFSHSLVHMMMNSYPSMPYSSCTFTPVQFSQGCNCTGISDSLTMRQDEIILILAHSLPLPPGSD